MSNRLKEKIIILVAPTGAQFAPEILPYMPITPDEIAEQAYRCYQAGASIVHIHARDPKTKYASPDVNLFNEIFIKVKERCGDMLIQMTGALGGWRDPSTNKWVRPTSEQRLAFLDADPKPDMMPTPMGTMDYFYADGSYTTVFTSPDHLRKFIPGIIKRKMGLELEFWDVSWLYNALRLADEGVFDRNMPLMLNYCLGAGVGFQPASHSHLVYVSELGKRLFPQSIWYQTTRDKDQAFKMLTGAMSLGCSVVRVGFEDHFYLPNGEIAKHNVQLVECAIKIAKDLGRDIATVSEAKEILSLSE